MSQNIKTNSTIFIVSGASGMTNHSMVNALLVQYPDNNISLEMVPNVQNKQQVIDLVQKAKISHAIITHTLVCNDIRNILIDECKREGIKQIDFMGPLATYIENEIKLKSINEPGLFRKQNSQYFQRIDAIEFTLNHDDGLNPERIHQADIVLTGVSRAGKTPLSVYMSMLGWKVANVPLVNGIEPPQELFEVDPNRVFGLKISRVQLVSHRVKRLKSFNNESNTNYVDQRKVNEEIWFADRIFSKGGFSVINVTNKPIETSSNEIIELISNRFGYMKQKINNPY
ncbi:MAG: kinase/pyrophosphorylase [Prolixibacteraceae bacterium]|jgi:regulator of PEP synthase PpsR (kinase-PPPase family)|nr:kinase/pyrophosphorylase [Prolixibacteraceae bacterium]